MNFAFLLTALLEAFTLFAETESWKWKFHSKDKPWHKHRNVRGDGCISGVCVKPWKCPDNAVSQKPTGSCAYWKNGPWVCCTIVNDITTNPQKQYNSRSDTSSTNKPIYEAPTSHSKRIVNNWRQTPRTTTEKWHDDEESWNTPCLEHPWNRNARERPTPISALGNVPTHSWDKSHTFYPANKPTTNPHETWSKSSEQSWNKRTSPRPLSTKVTNTWKKPSTSESRIIFPTDSPIWTQKRPTVTTDSWRKTTKILDEKSTMKLWPTYSTRITKNQWSTTKLPQKTFKTSYGANTRKPISSTKSFTSAWSDYDRKDQNWGKSTSMYPTPRQNTERNKISSTSVSTKRTTRSSRFTTPLPNVNTNSCGIRGRIISSRRARSYSQSYNPGTESVHKDSKIRDQYQRIVGGEEAEPYSWPWVVALYKVTSSGGHRFLSAGALINENFILTAAHVFTPDDLRTSSYVAMLGTHNAEDALAEYRVISVLQHPEYEQRYYYHDIALLRLETPVEFNDFVMPVCLPSPNVPLFSDKDLEGKNVTVMGWGDDSFGGKSSRVLKEATFPIVSRYSCNSSYIRVASNRFPKGITDNMLCAGDPKGGKDACQGDSGGPLTSVERGRHTQVGIVSFGYQCGDKEYPGVYTKVAPYLSWIAENTQRVNDYNYNDYDYNG